MKKMISLITQKMALCLSILLCLVNVPAGAQYTIYTSGNGPAETSPATPTFAPTWMNNAVFTNSLGSVYAEAWDEGTGTVYYEVHDNAGHSSGTLTVISPNAGTNTNPDVVLGGDNGNNFMAIVYTNTYLGNSNIYVEVYQINNVGAVTFAVANVCGAGGYVHQVSTSNHVGNAHIDMGNETYAAGTLVGANRFVIAWEDFGNGFTNGGPGGMATSATFSDIVANCGLATYTTTNTPLNLLAGPNWGAANDVDIAVRYDGSNGYTAYFTYRDYFVLGSTSYVYFGKWAIASNTVTKGVRIVNAGTGAGNNVEYPRIDVYDSKAFSTTDAFFDIVYRWLDPSPPAWNIMQVNNLAGPEQVTKPYGIGTLVNDNTKPVVTAGTEGPVSGVYYSLYSLAYANPNLDWVYLQNVVYATGNGLKTVGTNLDYREVNQNANIDGPVAISNDYIVDGTGTFRPDQIYVCWYNTGGTIDCNTNTNRPPLFKPTWLENTLSKNKNGIKVYPNPAEDMVVLEQGSTPVSNYTLCDVMGRVLLKGDVEQAVQPIDISQLAKGMYILNVSYKDSKQTDGIKIVKN